MSRSSCGSVQGMGLSSGSTRRQLMRLFKLAVTSWGRFWRNWLTACIAHKGGSGMLICCARVWVVCACAHACRHQGHQPEAGICREARAAGWICMRGRACPVERMRSCSVSTAWPTNTQAGRQALAMHTGAHTHAPVLARVHAHTHAHAHTRASTHSRTHTRARPHLHQHHALA